MKETVRPTSHYLLNKKYEYSSRNRCKLNEYLGKKKKYKVDQYNLVDRISELPDEILVSILSLLMLKEAITTSILSRRWRYVWAYLRTLNFQANFNICCFRGLNQERHRYVNWVNSVVKLHRSPTIKRFRVCLDLGIHFASSIDQWIQFAMEKGVQELELELANAFTDATNYVFPHKLIGLEKESALKHSDPNIPTLHSCGYNIGFKSLKGLHFKHIYVTREILEYFLFNCPVLERLTVLFPPKSLVNLSVVGPSIALKHLVMKYAFGIKNIEIRDANLVSFNYHGSDMNLHLSNVPMLVEVSIVEIGVNIHQESIARNFTQLSCCLSQIEILMLDIHEAVYNQNLVLPVLANLKHLELEIRPHYRYALRHLSSFMKASPHLQKIVLKLCLGTFGEFTEMLEKVAKCPHHYLKVVEILGYRARPCVSDHVMYFIKIAVALEKMVIDPVRRLWLCGTRLSKIEEEVKAREHAILFINIHHARQFIKRKIHRPIEFVCL